MQYREKVALVANEVIAELANLSKQKKQLTQESLSKALVGRREIKRVLEGLNGQGGPADGIDTRGQDKGSGYAIDSGNAGFRLSQTQNKALKRALVTLAVIAKREGSAEINKHLDEIKLVAKKDNLDFERLDRLLELIRNTDFRSSNPDCAHKSEMQSAKTLDYVEVAGEKFHFEAKPEIVEEFRSRFRAVLERLAGQLHLPENSEFSARVTGAVRKLGQNLSLNELYETEQEVFALLADYRKEMARDREILNGLLFEVARELVETEKEFLSSLLQDQGACQTGALTFTEDLKEQVSQIEDTLTYETNVERLRELVINKLGVIRKTIVERRKLEENRTKDFEARISNLRIRLEKNNEELVCIQRKAEEDALTGILNRRALMSRLKEYLKEFKSSHDMRCFIMLDLDHFKNINDRYGHLNGDKVLAAIGKCLKSRLRKHDLTFRYGGEEFSIILTNLSLNEAKNVAEQLRLMVENLEFVYKEERIPVTISLGVTDFRNGDAPDDIIERADAALYKAKEQGRNRVVMAP